MTNDAIPDWQLPPGVDRGLHDYFRAAEMVAGYDAQMAASPLAVADVAFCESHFPAPGRLVDLGCGTGRLCAHFAARGFDCVGVDLSDEMLDRARINAPAAAFVKANLVELRELPDSGFDYAACLFSTFGMIRGDANRRAALGTFRRVLKPGGVLVLHAHNRWFRGLGWRRFRSAEHTMPQAYGGAALTLAHFSRGGLMRMLAGAGFAVNEIRAVGIDGAAATGGNIYGYLVAAVAA